MQNKRCKTLAVLFGLGIFAFSTNAATLTGIDVGTPSNPGSVKTSTDANGKTVYEVTGGGGDIWGASDNFYYAYQKVTGDFDYVVKVASHIGNSGDGGWSKAELMVRLDDGSGTPQGGDPFIANMATRPSSDTANSAPAGVNYRGPQWRAVRDDQCSWTTPSPGYPPNLANNWLRLERVGSVFYMYTSDDGKAWNMYNPYSPQGWDTAGSWPAGTDNVGVSVFTNAWPSTIMLGLAVTAHNDADVSVVKFTDFGPYTPTPVAITSDLKASVSLAQNSELKLSVTATGDPVHYQWIKDGKPLAQAVTPTYTVALAQLSDAGKYKVRVYGGGKEVMSAESTVTVTVDTTAPTIKAVIPEGDFLGMRVEFSEPVSDSALTAANYKLDQGITVSSVSRISSSIVKLNTSKMGEGVNYQLTVNGVKDTANPANTIASDSKKAFKSVVFETGMVTYQRWDNVNGDPGDINAFTTAVANGTIRPSDINTAVTQFGGPWGAADNYSSKVSGWFIPATSGNYVFFLSADDQANLYLSTDDQPANKKLIAQEGGWSNQYQWSTPGSGDAATKRSDQFGAIEWPYGNQITLQAGKRYYMEILHDEGGGGDGSDVTFIKEGATDPTQDSAGMAMRGSVIGTYLDPNASSITFTQQPVNTQGVDGKKVTFKVAATGVSAYGSTMYYQWQKNGVNIPDATSASYTTPILTLSDSNAKYKCVITVPALSMASEEATLTVVPDTFAPVVTGVGSLVKGNAIELGVSFDESVDPTSAATAANYTLSKGTVTAARFLSMSPASVALSVSGVSAGDVVTVTVKNVKDLKGNAITSANKEVKVSNQFKMAAIGGTDYVEVNGESAALWPDDAIAAGSADFDLISSGSANWNNYDEATFVYEEVTGNFDKVVRVEYQDATSQWARAGLLARSGLDANVTRAQVDGGYTMAKSMILRVNPAVQWNGTAANNSYEWVWRDTDGGNYSSGEGGGAPAYPNAWLRMARTNQTFYAYRSSDGTTWTACGTHTFTDAEPMPDKLFVGMYYCPEFGNNDSKNGFGHSALAKFRQYGTFSAVKPVPGPMTIVKGASGITIDWQGSGILESATTVNGPWTAAGTAKPFVAQPTGTQMFFRLKAQ